MANPTIPSSSQELTAEWLTDALRETGAIKDSRVTAVDLKPDIAAGVGFLCELAQLGLTYDRPEPEAPASLIAKQPTPSVENREIADLFRFYEMESRFYEDIAGGISMRTARCYYNQRASDSTDFILLIEDLAPARVADQMTGCSLEQAELALRELAKFHAAWWESPKLDQLDWLPSINDPVRAAASQQSYQQAWGPFVELVGNKLPPAIIDIGERFGDQVAALLEQLAGPPVTISHGDYRLDNLFFASPEGGAPLTVIDWQIISRARGVFDAAYFMTGTLPPEVRKEKDEPFLRMYHSTLLENGVTGYDFDQCWHDYRASTLFCWLYSVIQIGSLDVANERGLALFNAILERNVAALIDLNAGELLSG